ncbi:polyphenol oxidase family protein [Sinomonas sp. ASV322]|uniref:polyphenol oxidase family protein n=1 Tax=Sinomonas sp. ASV322 TaxID=3041920 RepID=UPI0027DB4CD1|nr:polyphenol oxidase family protein [Sinomonas sp. ASV322]MDQ4500810.1 polyphenol oxidase family protein [Sinomonas sp. ASV322]
MTLGIAAPGTDGADAERIFWWRRDIRPGVTAAFTQVSGGNLAFHVGEDDDGVRSHRAALAGAVGVDRVRYMDQEHGDRAAWAEGSGDAPVADALLSRGLPVAVMVADCVPILVVGEFPDGRPALAAVHAGRAGLAAGVVNSAVDALREAGARGLEAWIGPSICGRCYEVPAALRDEIEAKVPGTASTTSWGTPGLDLPAGVESQLDALGVPVHLEAIACTFQETRLFSHRRAPGEGRFAGVVWAHG